MSLLKTESQNYYFWFNIPLHCVMIISLFYVSNWIVTLLVLIISYVLIYWLGVQAGTHKLFAHKNWTPKNNVIKYFIATLGCFGLMGGPVTWAQIHRQHHANSDTIDDPHTPSKGLLHAYILWLFNLREFNLITVKDLLRDTTLLTINKHNKHIVLIGLFILLILDFNVFAGTLLGCVLTFHSEMSVNAFLHYNSGSGFTSRNNKILSWISGGSSLHKNHHDNIRLNNLAVANGEFDGSYFFIKFLSK